MSIQAIYLEAFSKLHVFASSVSPHQGSILNEGEEFSVAFYVKNEFGQDGGFLDQILPATGPAFDDVVLQVRDGKDAAIVDAPPTGLTIALGRLEPGQWRGEVVKFRAKSQVDKITLFNLAHSYAQVSVNSRLDLANLVVSKGPKAFKTVIEQG